MQKFIPPYIHKINHVQGCLEYAFEKKMNFQFVLTICTLDVHFIPNQSEFYKDDAALTE